MRFITIILLCLLTTLLGCSRIYGEKGFIKDRDSEYLRAQSIPPLAIPPGYSSDTITAKYPVSNRQYTQNANVTLSPPGL